MKPLLPALLFSLGLSQAAVTPAAAYPVDCAILLCLAGGWPASAECALARAVFIRRITPWPIEPPLQIWNCPMHVRLQSDPPSARLLEISAAAQAVDLPASWIAAGVSLLPVAGQADVDIAGPAFDFVRSIRLFQIEVRRQRTHDGACNSWSSVRLGSYSAQGAFRWQASAPGQVPKASRLRRTGFCSDYSFRSVFVEWRDSDGHYGSEEVRY